MTESTIRVKRECPRQGRYLVGDTIKPCEEAKLSVSNGVDPRWISGTDFIRMHLDLVDALEGDFHAALLLDRIAFRAGSGWWAATYEQMREATRLSDWHVKRAAKKLRDMGWIESQRVSKYEAMLRWRVVVAPAETVGMVENESDHFSTDGGTTSGSESPYFSENESPYFSTSSKNMEELKDKNLPAVAERRDDVEMICTRLADHIEQAGLKRPTITNEWRRSARLMLDKDGIELDHALGAIDWAHNDDFWCANILSVPKLRKQYPRLLLQAQRQPGVGSNMARNLARIDQMGDALRQLGLS